MTIRIFKPQQEAMRWFKTDSEYGYALKKNFSQEFTFLQTGYKMQVNTNSFGHRWEEYNPNRFTNKGVKKVLLLGDSFTFGHGVNQKETFAFLLDSLLGLKNHLDYEVINSGVGGWGTLQELKYAKDHFERFRPDIIVLNFCPNDPRDDKMFKAKLADNEHGAINFPGKLFFKYNSQLYRFLYSTFHRQLHQKMMQKKIEENPELKLENQGAAVISKSDWQSTDNYITEFYTEYKNFNPEGQFLILTTSPWNKEIRSNLNSFCSQLDDTYYLDMYNETVNIPEEYRKLPHDGHWSFDMHRLAANKICSKIDRMEIHEN